MLVVSAETLSRIVDYTDRGTCILFGDGAAAAVYRATEDDNLGIQSTFIAADGSGAEYLRMEALPVEDLPQRTATVDPKARFLKMQGAAVVRFTARAVPQAIDTALQRAGITADDIDWVVPHQANLRILDVIARRYHLPKEKVYVNMDRFGNTSSASVPICPMRCAETDCREGQTIVCTGFGGGLSRRRICNFENCKEKRVLCETKITELLGIEYPIVQGAMAWIAEHHLAAAVSKAGGLGIIAGGAAPVDYIRDEIRKAREITDKPLGMNIMLLSPNADDLAQLAIDEKIEVLTTGAGNPGKYMAAWKNAGIKIMPVVASVALAKRMERAGADAVIAEGMEGGGHIGELTTMPLVPQVVDALSIPVIAAGGIADGRGMAASFMLGAEGVQCGTVFLASNECCISDKYKELVLKATDISTVVTGRPSGHPVRSLKTPMARKCLELEKENTDASLEELEKATAGSLRKAVQDGNYEEGTFMSGQIAGMLRELRPCEDILKGMTAEAEELLKNAYKRFE